jgi:hypothetical protein
VIHFTGEKSIFEVGKQYYCFKFGFPIPVGNTDYQIIQYTWEAASIMLKDGPRFTYLPEKFG